MCRDCQRERIRQEKLKIYRETGVWPKTQQGSKRISCKQTEPWSLSKQRKIERKNKRDTRKLRKQQQQDSGVYTKHKRKRNVSQEDIDELAKDIALIKKLKRKKVRIVLAWTIFCWNNCLSMVCEELFKYWTNFYTFERDHKCCSAF